MSLQISLTQDKIWGYQQDKTQRTLKKSLAEPLCFSREDEEKENAGSTCCPVIQFEIKLPEMNEWQVLSKVSSIYI